MAKIEVLYTSENRLLVVNAKNMLELANIESYIKNEFAGGAVGDLAPMGAWPELWLVDESQREKAETVLKVLDEKLEGEDWVCPNCNEANTSTFEVCWNCQTERVIK
jgi:hypothetical protein